MKESLDELLDQVAQRGSWVGGGSAAALTAALAVALVEKLSNRPQRIRQLRRLRQQCLALVQQDARTFARAIRATRSNNHHGFQRALKAATAVQVNVFTHAHAIQTACRLAKRSIKPRFQSDLRCAQVLATASSHAARALILTNLAWLNDPRSTARLQRRLRTITQRSRH